MTKPFLISFQKYTSLDNASLFAAESGNEVHFEIKRVFWLSSKDSPLERGHHALLLTQQILIALNGEVRIEFENQQGEKLEFVLSDQGKGVYIPPMWWHVIYYLKNSSFMVMASTLYDESDYIRDYSTFKSYKL